MESETKRKTYRELPCKLTEREILSFSRELAKLNQDRAECDARKKVMTAEYGEKLKRFDADIALTSNKIASGIEHRSVECVWEFDFSADRKYLYRSDTGEKVGEDFITDEEREQQLFKEQSEGETE